MFVVQSNSDFVCHSEKCKEKRAVHVASGIPFSCEHCNLLKSFSSPPLAKNLHEDDFRHVVEISQSCYAVYHGASQDLSNPTGYCHVQKRDGLFRCMNKSCSKTGGLVHFAFASFSISQMNMADEDVIKQVRSK